MSSDRRRDRRPRRPPPPVASGGRGHSRLLLAFVLVLGIWIGRIIVVAPSGMQGALDIVLAFVSAAIVAVWYRRRVRRALDQRAARRGRAQRPPIEDGRTHED